MTDTEPNCCTRKIRKTGDFLDYSEDEASKLLQIMSNRLPTRLLSSTASCYTTSLGNSIVAIILPCTKKLRSPPPPLPKADGKTGEQYGKEYFGETYFYVNKLLNKIIFQMFHFATRTNSQA
jgi:hypothetical protein